MVVPSTLKHRLLRSVEPLEGRPYGTLQSLVSAKTLDANLVSSQLEASTFHAPVLDLDFPCSLIPSSTPGHHHLFIDAPMEWKAYKTLLCALRDAGILQAGFVNSAIDQGQSSVRVPWVRKP
jgi:hypothetical protein